MGVSGYPGDGQPGTTAGPAVGYPEVQKPAPAAVGEGYLGTAAAEKPSAPPSAPGVGPYQQHPNAYHEEAHRAAPQYQTYQTYPAQPPPTVYVQQHPQQGAAESAACGCCGCLTGCLAALCCCCCCL